MSTMRTALGMEDVATLERMFDTVVALIRAAVASMGGKSPR